FRPVEPERSMLPGGGPVRRVLPGSRCQLAHPVTRCPADRGGRAAQRAVVRPPGAGRLGLARRLGRPDAAGGPAAGIRLAWKQPLGAGGAVGRRSSLPGLVRSLAGAGAAPGASKLTLYAISCLVTVGRCASLLSSPREIKLESVWCCD